MTMKISKSRATIADRATERRGAIVAVALEVFLEHGYSGASMSQIADRVGGSKGTLYNYFSSKEELFLAVAEDKGRELYSTLQTLPRPSGDLAKDLHDLGLAMLKIVASDNYLSFYRLIIAEAARVPVIGKMAYDSRRSAMLEPLCELIRGAMAVGHLRMIEPMEAAEIFWDLCTSSIHRRLLLAVNSGPTPKELARLVERAVAIFIAGFATGA
jgi:TetR/AcrR family transcriptional regulator, mexJK operon transcriptional repressor